MAKEKLKERKQLIKKSKSEEFEVRFQKAIKRDSKRTEEDKKKRSEDNCLDKNESFKKQRKRRKNGEQTAFASGKGAKESKEKHIQTDKLSGGKQQEYTKNSAALDGGSNFKGKSDSFSSGKKKWEEEKDTHFSWSFAEMKKLVHKHDESGKKSKNNHRQQSVRGDEREVSLKSDLEIGWDDDYIFDSGTKKRKRKTEKECTKHTGKSEKKGIEISVGHYQVSERTDIVKKKKKNDDSNDNDDNSMRKRKRKADPEEEYFLDEIEAVKKKKRKKSKDQPGEKSKPTVHPGVSYLHTWHKDRQNWNFKKVRQVWLLQNMFDHEQISNEDFGILLKYLEGLKGAAKDKTIEMAEQRIESGTGEQDAVVETRVRQVLQLLTD